MTDSDFYFELSGSRAKINSFLEAMGSSRDFTPKNLSRVARAKKGFKWIEGEDHGPQSLWSDIKILGNGRLALTWEWSSYFPGHFGDIEMLSYRFPELDVLIVHTENSEDTYANRFKNGNCVEGKYYGGSLWCLSLAAADMYCGEALEKEMEVRVKELLEAWDVEILNYFEDTSELIDMFLDEDDEDIRSDNIYQEVNDLFIMTKSLNRVGSRFWKEMSPEQNAKILKIVTLLKAFQKRPGRLNHIDHIKESEYWNEAKQFVKSRVWMACSEDPDSGSLNDTSVLVAIVTLTPKSKIAKGEK